MNDLCKYAILIQCGPFACVDHENKGEPESRAAKIEERKAQIEREIRRGLRAWPTCNVTGQPVTLEWMNPEGRQAPYWFCGSCGRRYAADSAPYFSFSSLPVLGVNGKVTAVGGGQAIFGTGEGEPLPEYNPGDYLPPSPIKGSVARISGIVHVYINNRWVPVGDMAAAGTENPMYPDFHIGDTPRPKRETPPEVTEAIEKFKKFQGLPSEVLECKASDIAAEPVPIRLNINGREYVMGPLETAWATRKRNPIGHAQELPGPTLPVTLGPIHGSEDFPVGWSVLPLAESSEYGAGCHVKVGDVQPLAEAILNDWKVQPMTLEEFKRRESESEPIQQRAPDLCVTVHLRIGDWKTQVSFPREDLGEQSSRRHLAQSLLEAVDNLYDAGRPRC